jgi:single-strand DNA-binding protein
MSINRVVLCGNLTRDAELRTTANGTNVLNLGIAVNERYRNAASGEWEDRPNYFDCVMFGARAQAISQYMTRGQKVIIEGKLRWSQWEKDGQKRSKVEVVVDDEDTNSALQVNINNCTTDLNTKVGELKAVDYSDDEDVDPYDVFDSAVIVANNLDTNKYVSTADLEEKNCNPA